MLALVAARLPIPLSRSSRLLPALVSARLPTPTLDWLCRTASRCRVEQMSRRCLEQPAAVLVRQCATAASMSCVAAPERRYFASTTSQSIADRASAGSPAAATTRAAARASAAPALVDGNHCLRGVSVTPSTIKPHTSFSGVTATQQERVNPGRGSAYEVRLPTPCRMDLLMYLRTSSCEMDLSITKTKKAASGGMKAWQVTCCSGGNDSETWLLRTVIARLKSRAPSGTQTFSRAMDAWPCHTRVKTFVAPAWSAGANSRIVSAINQDDKCNVRARHDPPQTGAFTRARSYPGTWNLNLCSRGVARGGREKRIAQPAGESLIEYFPLSTRNHAVA